MKAQGLMDSSGLIALVDRSEEWHERCVQSFADLRLPLGTTCAVLTDMFHLLTVRESKGVWALLRDGVIQVLPIEHGELADVQALMDRYSDRPMDFADATLVHVARRENLQAILSIDDDFLVYRIEGRQQFQVYPPR